MLHFQLLPFPELHTPRLLLRRLTTADAPALLRLRSDEQVMRYLDREPATGLASSLEVLGQIDASLLGNSGLFWGVARLAAPQELLGTCGPWRLDPANHRGEIGYSLLPEAWGQGLMHEALTAVCHYCFGMLGLHSLEAHVNPHNAASIRLLERLGFVREAYFRENHYFQGQFLDSAIYSRLARQGEVQ